MSDHDLTFEDCPYCYGDYCEFCEGRGYLEIGTYPVDETFWDELPLPCGFCHGCGDCDVCDYSGSEKYYV